MQYYMHYLAARAETSQLSEYAMTQHEYLALAVSLVGHHLLKEGVQVEGVDQDGPLGVVAQAVSVEMTEA